MREGILRECGVRQVHLTEGYGKRCQDLMLDRMLPYQMKLYLENGGPDVYRRAAGYRLEREDTGMVADAGKLFEAAAYALMLREDPKLRETMEELVSLMAEAQLADGYLVPGQIAEHPSQRFLSLTMSHEHYSLGHTIEAMLAYYEATGNETALDIARKIGDCLYQWFGTQEGQIRGYCGHPEVELALYKLYRATGEARYLEVMAFFVDERGQSPKFFDLEQERNRRKYGKPVLGGLAAWADNHRRYWGNYEYFQAHKPARELTEPVGHAVRALYFYCGMADLAAETGDAALETACRRLFDQLEQNNHYLTGGVGQEPFWEGIGQAYDLPPDDAYNETCASVGLILFAQRMLKLSPEGRLADLMENALYNTVAGGVGLDGEHYFYGNQLSIWPADNYRHDKISVEPARWAWTSCPCCPPNVARLYGELGGFVWLYDEENLFLNLYLPNRTTFSLGEQEVTLSLRTGYPWTDTLALSVEEGGDFSLHLRIPGWCRGASLCLNGEEMPLTVEHGYAVLTRRWHAGDVVVLTFPMPPRRVYANPNAYHYLGKVAVARGPVVYCLEEADNGKLLPRLQLPQNSVLTDCWEPDFLGGCWTITAEGVEILKNDTPLYSSQAPTLGTRTLRFIPYALRANRTPGELQVFLQETKGKEG